MDSKYNNKTVQYYSVLSQQLQINLTNILSFKRIFFFNMEYTFIYLQTKPTHTAEFVRKEGGEK